MKWAVVGMLAMVCQVVTGQISVQAYLDSTEIYLGDQVNLHVEVVNLRENTDVRSDLAPLDTVTGLEILKVEPWTRVLEEDPPRIRRKIIITSFDSGYHWIPELEVEVNVDGEMSTFHTERIPLLVRWVKLDSLVLAPIKPIDKEPITWQDFKPYVILLSILALVALGVFLYMRYASRPAAEELPPEEQKPPHLIALEKLDRLKASKLWQQGLIVEYQSEVTYIMREYFEAKFGILALESTTDEILSQVQSLGLEQYLIDHLRETLQLADLVKFAKAQPSIEFHQKIMDFATRFVLATKDWTRTGSGPDNDEEQ